MADATWAPGSGRDDNWGPSTPVRSASANPAPAPAPQSATTSTPPRGARRDHAPQRQARSARSSSRAAVDDGWQSGPPRGRQAKAQPSVDERVRAATEAGPQRGVRPWVALLLLVAVLVVGILIDSLRGEQLSTGFDLGIIVGSIIAIVAVTRSGMFWVVVSPPIVYSLGAGISLYLRSGGLHDRGVLIDAATNWLVYGFPAIAAASAAVLIIAGFRLIMRK